MAPPGDFFYKYKILSDVLFTDTLMDNNNRTREFRFPFFDRFLQFSQKIQKPTIPHFKGLIMMGILILEGHIRVIIRGSTCALFVKKQTFQKKRLWQALEAATPMFF